MVNRVLFILLSLLVLVLAFPSLHEIPVSGKSVDGAVEEASVEATADFGFSDALNEARSEIVDNPCHKKFLEVRGSEGSVVTESGEPACESVTVRCENPSSGDAMCNRRACEITLRPEVCRLLGIPNGGDLSILPFLERLYLGPLEFCGPDGSDGECWLSILYRCEVVHELTHARQPNGMIDCYSEHEAYRESQSCLELMQGRLCTGGDSNVCRAIRKQICLVEGQLSLQSCRCLSYSRAHGQPCPGCKSICSSAISRCGERDDIPIPQRGIDSFCAQNECLYCSERSDC
ncbi:MAG: hypothetical protein J0M12_04515 [Deltaproteobacteria bacterium]|nr:hypothetical protein [Deltaproteobacteria bacterium]